MDLHLKGRTALVTGGSRGIGLAVARVLAAEGCNLHIAARTASHLEAARKEIARDHAVEVTAHPVDLSRREDAVTLARACGPLDILVNNAGAIPGGAIAAVDDATWRAAWDLKVFGFINLVRELYPGMCARRHGVIVNIVGAAGERPSPGYIAGSMANAALMAMSRALGSESLDHGVRVVAVNPGAIETERIYALLKTRARNELGDEARWPELTKGLPGGRLGAVDEVANTVAFLCSDRASYTSGTVITIDGGASARK